MSEKANTPIPITKPWLDEEEAEAAKRAILSGWVTQGPEVAAFENELADFFDSKYACVVSNGTAALHLALLAAGIRSADEVITVSHSFIATANSVRYCGAIPMFVDVQPETYNINPSLIESVITERTRAILCVHQMGMPCDLKAILDIARRHSLLVIEDAACAIGSEIFWNDRWEKIGKSHADIACFSFHPSKLITTGEGGVVTTSNSDWDQKIRILRQQSMDITPGTRHGSKDVMFESYNEIGYNFRMTDIQAAIGRVQLKRLPEMVERRRFLVERYRKLLVDVPGIRLPEEPPWARSNWQRFCLRLPDGCNQRRIMQAMLDSGIATRRGTMCAHREPAYRQERWYCGETREECNHPKGTCVRLIESEKLQDQGIILPLFHAMTEAEQDKVVNALWHACTRSEMAFAAAEK